MSLTQVLVSYCEFLIQFGAICVHGHYAHLSLDNAQSKDNTN